MKLLRINMENLTYRYEDLPDSELLWGGRALTSKIVHDEVPPTAHPLGPHNKLVLANGVLTGSLASSAERSSMGGKSPLTGGIKESNAGGTAGLKLGRLGLRAIIFEGIRDDFQIIRIHKDGVEFEPARDLLDQPISEAAAKIRQRYGEDVGLYMIGVAGERKMLTAAIANMDKDKSPTRFYGRGGLGAVAGAKGIKAVILDDTGVERNKPKDPQRFRSAMKIYAQWLREAPGTGKIFPELGTAAMVKTTNKLGALPTRNFSTGSFEGHEAISGETLRETILARGGEGTPTHACMPGCAIRCSNIYADVNGKRITSPIEYENIGLLGSNLGIDDLDAVVELNRLCNEYGVDTIETGAAIGVAMEAGLLNFGDKEGAINLLKELGEGTPLGRIIGGGAELVGKIYGVRKVPVVKGQAMPAYDPRSIKGLGVTFATSPQGADHTAGQTVRAQVNHHDASGQVEVSREAQKVNTIFDILGICYFASSAVAGRFDLLADMVSGYIGREITADDIVGLAQETLRMEHAFNRGAGMTKAHDRLPEHFYEEINPASQTVFDVPEEELLAIGTEGRVS
ncbi:aldehyde:ferredoxin oxidoreductase [Caldalkalibacillus uzonensis]|uniref:Aldehyde:ferredoxin oxidoreductase n=1 Tax=Caldalkalibacillus uzonensis TaxID=353224 RepID=A0ABU0CNS4_9BACI|nr:aldehyde ferredoxin oxidoreductase C-terminal domain-containing protein [Caldalkalibacillus uzonensis]MDQ0338054.1 aldehyde:ferredoxin oxidoreductase [Caldalkalibacillus uzonensis]